ncbi:MAG TPA: phytanoyl-CoA dioxygenase family protein, partial [Puia sp.]
RLHPTPDNKLLFANRQSGLIQSVTRDQRLMALLGLILGKEVVPFQTINFMRGSNQRAHSDSIHMTTYPLGYLIAVWIALEDTNMDNGPLFYYPGSHKLPYLLNEDFNEGSTGLRLGNKDYVDYEDRIAELIEQRGLEKEVFLAKKGDILIWHANLIHGGLPVRDTALTRKSMVIHYYAKDVIKYHEITERPSLMR